MAWTVRAFRASYAGVRDDTQIHTHMCYGQFDDIMAVIDAMGVDVISLESTRGDSLVVQSVANAQVRAAVGPGVYDIHSPRIPGVEEIAARIERMVAAARRVREEYGGAAA